MGRLLEPPVARALARLDPVPAVVGSVEQHLRLVVRRRDGDAALQTLFAVGAMSGAVGGAHGQREGGASVTLTGDLETWAIQSMRDATGGAIDILTTTLQPIADTASNEWYGPQGVSRVTGQSGRIEVVSTVDANKGVVRVSVGSTDTREVLVRKAMVPVPSFVHRGYSATTTMKAVSKDEFFAAPASTRVGVAKYDWEFLPDRKSVV